MRRVVAAALLAVALSLGASASAQAQCITNLCVAPPTTVTTTTTVTRPITPLGWYAIGSLGCVAVSPMAGTLLLGRKLTVMEVDRMTLSCFLGPLGWVLGPALFPDPVLTTTTPPPNPPNQPPPRQARGHHIDIPSRGIVAFVNNEILTETESGTPAQYLNVVARRLGLTLLETQSFTLTGRTLQRWRIGRNTNVRATLQGLLPFGRIAAQPNYFYVFGQAQAAVRTDAGAQYVVPKLHLMEAHKITSGGDVLVAVIDSKIDALGAVDAARN
jgi:hypothetical protein